MIQVLTERFGMERLGEIPKVLDRLVERLDQDPVGWLASVAAVPQQVPSGELPEWLERSPAYPQVMVWEPIDTRRVLPCPVDHYLLVRLPERFRVWLKRPVGKPIFREAVPVQNGWIAVFGPVGPNGEGGALLQIERYGTEGPKTLQGSIRFCKESPTPARTAENPDPQGTVLLTNRRGGMARLAVDLGRIFSKYDCALAANFDPTVPVDRHVLAKRLRIWINADGFLFPLRRHNLWRFEPGPPARWFFRAHAGDARLVELHLEATMLPGENTTIFRFTRPKQDAPKGRGLPDRAIVSLTVRVDIEDRNFHQETRFNDEARHFFLDHTRTLQGEIGFRFAPATDRQLLVVADAGIYHPQPEWCEGISHPVEATRGMVAQGDAFSPGWFEIPLSRGESATLILTAEQTLPSEETIVETLTPKSIGIHSPQDASTFPSSQRPEASKTLLLQSDSEPAWVSQLQQALDGYVVRRGTGHTIIAGYPWFLDWGRDTLIVCRGFLALGRIDLVREILLTFASLEREGTLPNALYGADDSNRESSDAPLWFALACEELAALLPNPKTMFYDLALPDSQRTIQDVLHSIGRHYAFGTTTGIHMDRQTGLIYSPPHFTWMDTNYPACTPREGYPIEIQALWIRLLRHLARIGIDDPELNWTALADQAQQNLETLFWLEEPGWYSDVLTAQPNQSALEAIPRTDLRPNALLPIALGILTGSRAQRTLLAARRYLLLPGALRSLAPLPIHPPLEILDRNKRPLIDPHFPYQGRYEGDEDTRRKPAYHNGTGWVWCLPIFCEALVRAFPKDPAAASAAQAWLGSVDPLVWNGCIGQLPEIVDGDQPHSQRGCDAQAWSVSEALRVWVVLSQLKREGGHSIKKGK